MADSRDEQGEETVPWEEKLKINKRHQASQRITHKAVSVVNRLMAIQDRMNDAVMSYKSLKGKTLDEYRAIMAEILECCFLQAEFVRELEAEGIQPKATSAGRISNSIN